MMEDWAARISRRTISKFSFSLRPKKASLRSVRSKSSRRGATQSGPTCRSPGIIAALVCELLVLAASAALLAWRCEGHCHVVMLLVDLVGSIVNLVATTVFAICNSWGARDVSTVHANLFALLGAVFLVARVWEHETRAVFTRIVLEKCANVALVIVSPIYMFIFLGLIEGRMRLTEAGFGANLGSCWIRRQRNAYLAVELLLLVMVVSLGPERKPTLAWTLWICIHNGATALLYFTTGFTAFRCFSAVLRAMRVQSLPASSYAGRERRWARRVLQNLRWFTALQCLLAGLMHAAVVLSLYFCQEWYEVAPAMHNLARSSIIFSEIISLLAITGLFRPQRSAALLPPPRRSQQQQKTRVTSGAWQATVHSLAGRSISVGELLDFYELLGQPNGPMPHYHPEASTTNDVVRQAIIPLSRTPEGGGEAYTSLLNGPRALPQLMVTHTWASLFVHLVAAVVADALGRDEYDSTAVALAIGEAERLRAELRAHGTLDRTCWICAFSVNQHAGICGGFGHEPAEGSAQRDRWEEARRDTVTGHLFTPCPCSQPKLFNASFPEECEMNKFDDMIELLSEEVPDFSHLVAVDENYDVFMRAWCVAELHRVYFLDVPQRVCVQANCVLDIDTEDLEIYKKLATLTVTDCEASRPQDKAEILERILDTQEFDEQLQEVIFGKRGLLRRKFEGFGVLEAVARTAFRVAKAQAFP